MPGKQVKIVTLKIVLCESKPEIWRRFQIGDEMTLGDLHNVVQIVMGWEDCHLHDFEQGKKRYSKPDPEGDDFGPPVMDEDKVTIYEVLKQKDQKLAYIYDMGDYWQHTLTVEDISIPEPNQCVPTCLGGAYACPPEDSGGAWGYRNMLDALADPKHDEHETFVEWIGPDFDAEEFDLKEINEVLHDYENYKSGRDDFDGQH